MFLVSSVYFLHTHLKKNSPYLSRFVWKSSQKAKGTVWYGGALETHHIKCWDTIKIISHTWIFLWRPNKLEEEIEFLVWESGNGSERETEAKVWCWVFGLGSGFGGGGGGGVIGSEQNDGGSYWKEEERVRDDVVHGNTEGLRVLRGDTCPAEIARWPPRGRRSRRHCRPRRPSPMGPSSVSLSKFTLITFPFSFFLF